MKLLIFLFFIIPSLSLFAEPFFYEGFSETGSGSAGKHKIIPSPSNYLVSGLIYPDLKTDGKALEIKDGKKTFIFLHKNIATNNSIWVSYLVKMDKIYGKNFSAILTLSDNSGTNKLTVNAHINAGNDTAHFNKKIIRKNTILVVINIINNSTNSNIVINFNPVINSFSKTNSISDYSLIKQFNKFVDINNIAISAKEVDAVFDEIRCGTAMENVLPSGEKKELTEEELLGNMDDNFSGSQSNSKNTFFVSNSFLESIVIIKGGKGVGTGFVVKEDSNNYIYTNVHVLMGNSKMKFINKDGKKLRPISIETTPGRDIVRLKIKNNKAKALHIAESPVNNTSIAVCGNSGGGGVIRTLYGKILGVGPDKIETNAKFISGNSGSPLMLEDGSVIGIATYIRKANVNWVNTNTPFTVTRRFAYRIDNIDHWKKISPRTFLKEAKILQERNKKIKSLIEVLDIWAKSPYWNRIQARDDVPRPMALWIDNQNEWVEHNHMRFKSTRGRAANVRNLSRELIKELNGNVDFLKKSLKRSCSFKKRKWAVPYFKDYSDDMDRLENILVKAIDNIAEAATATDPVYLKRK